MSEDVRLRDVEQADLEVFFAQEQDPEAARRSLFPPRERDVFMTHWAVGLLVAVGRQRQLVVRLLAVALVLAVVVLVALLGGRGRAGRGRSVSRSPASSGPYGVSTVDEGAGAAKPAVARGSVTRGNVTTKPAARPMRTVATRVFTTKR